MSLVLLAPATLAEVSTGSKQQPAAAVLQLHAVAHSGDRSFASTSTPRSSLDMPPAVCPCFSVPRIGVVGAAPGTPVFSLKVLDGSGQGELRLRAT
jgi:hypothetical protein